MLKSPTNAAPAAINSISCCSSPMVYGPNFGFLMFRGIYQLVNFLLQEPGCSPGQRSISSAWSTGSRYESRIIEPAQAFSLLLKQHLGDHNPKTEETDKGCCCKNGFHTLYSCELVDDPILEGGCFREISQK